MEKQEPSLNKSETTTANNKLHGHAMLKKEKPMLSVAALIQAHGKLWDRQFAGNEEGFGYHSEGVYKSGVKRSTNFSLQEKKVKDTQSNIGHI